MSAPLRARRCPVDDIPTMAWIEAQASVVNDDPRTELVREAGLATTLRTADLWISVRHVQQPAGLIAAGRGEVAAALVAAEDRWSVAGPASYDLECRGCSYGPSRATVLDGEVVERDFDPVDRFFGAETEARSSVPDAFALLGWFFERWDDPPDRPREPGTIVAVFDPATGASQHIWIDDDLDAVDDDSELHVFVTPT